MLLGYRALVHIATKINQKTSTYYQLRKPTQKTENIISDFNFLPFSIQEYHYTFHHESNGNF